MPGELRTSPRDVCIGLIVALGVLTIVKDLLAAAERLRLAAEIERDPEAPARAMEEYLREEHDVGTDHE